MNDTVRPGSTLVIMAKAPQPGRVKTRLSECLPPAAIPQLYSCLLADTIALAQSLPDTETAIMCPAGDVAQLSYLAGGTIRVVAQDGMGLAAALDSVFFYFTMLGRKRIVAFNSDSPHLASATLVAAFSALETSDLVAGPTHDGGYYLVGAKASHAGLFSSDGIGTASALETLLQRARSLGLTVSLTETFYDVDIRADLARLTAELKSRPERAPRTARWLADWSRRES